MYLPIIKEQRKILKFYDTPFYVYLNLSNICNANCVFCEVKTNKEKKCAINVKNVIDELADLGTKYIHFTGGGEPFINDDIFEYLDYCTQKNIKIVLISNGLNLNEEKIREMSNYNIVAFFFSIDSSKADIHDKLRGVNGLFKKATENINLIKKYIPNVKVILNHVLNRENIDGFASFIKLKKKVNFDYINPIVIKDYPPLFFTKEQMKKYTDNLNDYYELAKEFNIKFLCEDINFFSNDNVSDNGDRANNLDLRCVYPSYCAFIDAPSKKVYPCDCSIHRDRNLYCLGDLEVQTFKEIWDGKRRKELKELLLNSKLDCKKKCDECNCMFNNFYFKKKEITLDEKNTSVS